MATLPQHLQHVGAVTHAHFAATERIGTCPACHQHVM
ncbi:hypothetical protein E2C01_099908 [Portunus trituberculatus]|uniref:Uncharacterized protein n=1 Tax=Portunus trituberculatus TaxID=210409 RepID=A0A5B7K6P7_PORTR|nr:hypothetical protein [Portunus trituberculatus]